MKKLGFFLLVMILLQACSQPKEKEKPVEPSDKVELGDKIFIQSDVLGEEREIWIYTPKGFYGMDETNVRYPVVYVMDGEGQFLSTVGALEQMSSPFSANDIIPQMIVVGIVNTNRNRDLTPTKAMLGKDSTSLSITGGADKMAAFMEKELIPYINENYPTAPHNVLIGHSLGGLFVLNTLLKSPHLFQNYLAIDPFLRWDNQAFSNSVIEGLQKGSYKRKKLFIATANTRMSWLSLEDVLTDTSEIMYSMRSTLEFRDSMEKIELNFSYMNKYYEDENHFQIPLIATYDGFRHLYDFYPFSEMIDYYYPRDKESDLMVQLQNHYQNISKEMGYDIVPMESYINSWAFGIAEFDREDLALKLLDLNIKNYPDSYNVYSAKGYALLAQKDSMKAKEYFERSLEIKEVSHVKSALESLSEVK